MTGEPHDPPSAVTTLGAMFLNWKVTPLSSRGHERGGSFCPHDTKATGRTVLTPQVCVSKRVDGKPKRIILHTFGASVRTCCTAETEAPRARMAFWGQVRASWARAGWLDGLPDRAAAIAELEAAIGQRVLVPTAEEMATWQAMCVLGVMYTSRPTRFETEVGAWQAAQERLAAYRQGRRKGETMRDWADRQIAEETARHRARQDPWADLAEKLRQETERLRRETERMRQEAEERARQAEEAARGRRASAGSSSSRRRKAPPPPPAEGPLWWLAELRISAPFTADAVRQAYRRLAFNAHPDRGGTHEAMVRLNRARDAALAFLSV